MIETKKPPFKFLLVAVGVSLLVGSFVGALATRAEGFSFLRSIFGRVSPFPGRQADGSLVFSNFETPTDLRVWRLISARMTLSTQNNSEGFQSAHVTFAGGKDLAALMIEDLANLREKLSDWSGYESLRFYLFNPTSEPQTLRLLITDIWGKKYERDLNLPGGKGQEFSVSVDEMAHSLSIHQINQLSLSMPAPPSEVDLFLDHVRLEPRIWTPGGGGTPAGIPKTAGRPVQMLDYGFAKRKPAWEVTDPLSGNRIVRVPFIVRNETNALCRLCPVEGGIPFPMRELKDIESIRIRNAQGEELPFQARVLARWPDQSIKWLGLNYQTTLAPFEGSGYFLEYGPRVKALDFSGRLKVTEDEKGLRVDTGVLEALFNKKRFFLFEKISLDENGDGVFSPEEKLFSEAALTLRFRGQEYRTDLDPKTYKIEVEQKGTQRVVVKASGWFQSEKGRRFCQAIVRTYFYEGKSEVKVSHTLIYTGYPENKQFLMYKLLKLPANETIEAFGIRIPYEFSKTEKEQVLLGRVGSEPQGFQLGESVRLLQQDWESAALERDEVRVPSKDTYAGWLDVSDSKRGVTFALRNFRENFPKAFKINAPKKEIHLDLWPEEAGPIDLSTSPEAVGPDDYGRGSAFGLGKTHEMLFYFHKGRAEETGVLDKAASFAKPLILRTNPYWIDATGALGRLNPVEAKYATEEKMLARLFDWAARQPNTFKWYGMLNFGDTLTWWRDADDERHSYKKNDWHPVGRWGWYNCEGVGTHTGALLQFARSGEWKYFEFGANLAQHILDVDTIHYDTIGNDPRLKRLLDRKSSQVGAMHRHSANHWSGRTDEASHTSVVGLLLYYYLTGNERALDVIKEVGEYFLKKPFTYAGYPHVAPHRAMSNALWGDVLLYELTQDERYKKAADKVIEIFLKGQQSDGSFLENYNPLLHTWRGEKHEIYMGWYTVGALISYHELTQDPEVKEMLLKLVRYLETSEYMGPSILHGMAYAYLITHDREFFEAAQANLNKLLSEQQFSQDPLLDGQLYEKLIYHRPMVFLSTVPYVFGLFEEHLDEASQ